MARGAKLNMSKAMASNVAKKLPDVLTREELAEIAYIMAVESVWFDTWKKDPYNHWVFKGEDGYGTEELVITDDIVEEREILYIDMRGYFYDLPNYDGGEPEQREIGWVPCERILPWANGVVPRAINLFVERWFGVSLFGYGLYFYYQCQPFQMVIGGRGSGKTTQIALASVAWIALHPGENWVHFAFTLEQAKIAYQVVSTLGKESTLGAGAVAEGDGRSFFDVWVAPGGFRESPYPKITLRSWNRFDPGNTIDYRPLNPSSGATQNRSFSCARCSLDEVTRDVDDESVLAVAEGTVRGPNMVKLKQLSLAERKRVHDLMEIQTRFENLGYAEEWHEHYGRYLAVVEEIESYGLGRHGGRIRVGNKGNATWIEERMQLSIEEPTEQFSAVVPFVVNPWLSRQDRKNYMGTFRDPDQAMEELMGITAEGSGMFFTVGSLKRGESAELTKTFERDGELKEWNSYTYYGALPWKPGYSYVVVSDPGTGRIPQRNAYVVMVWRLHMDKAKAELCFFDWGAVGKPAGKWGPFLDSLNRARVAYKVQPYNCTVCVGGTEEGILEANFANMLHAGKSDDDESVDLSHLSFVNPVHLSGANKFGAANKLKEMLGYGWLSWPDVFRSFKSQHSAWDATSDKKIAQDIVAANLGGAALMYSYMAEFLEKDDTEPTYRDEYRLGRRPSRMLATRFG